MKLLIQIPCYNEAETLEIALNDLPRTLQGIEEIEYLIINDGSRDNTVEVARRWGVHHVVSFKQNKGLAKGFMAGLDGRADMVTGARSIDQTAHFSLLKKKLQHFGSWVVRRASNTDSPDAPSGFRAFSRDAAMRINVVNDYTFTLEKIVQAGREKMAVTSVPVRTNAELRPSRLFNSIWGYVKKSMLTILRAYMMYKPLKTFSYLAVSPILTGLLIGFRFLYYMARGQSGGHVQSLILACTLIIMGFLTFMIGLLADVIAANRKLLQDTQYHARMMEYDAIYMQMKAEKEAVRTYRLINGEEAAPPAKAKER